MKPNSRNSRPRSPGRNEIGTNTAASVSVVAMTAKPISRVPLIAATSGGSPSSAAAMDVLEHHDRIVDDQADREHQPEQRQHVDRVAHRVHDSQRRDDGHGMVTAGNHRRAHVAEECIDDASTDGARTRGEQHLA